MKHCKLIDAMNKTGSSVRSSRGLQLLKMEIRAVDIRMKLNVFQLLYANASFQSEDRGAVATEGGRIRLITKGI